MMFVGGVVLLFDRLLILFLPLESYGGGEFFVATRTLIGVKLLMRGAFQVWLNLFGSVAICCLWLLVGVADKTECCSRWDEVNSLCNCQKKDRTTWLHQNMPHGQCDTWRRNYHKCVHSTRAKGMHVIFWSKKSQVWQGRLSKLKTSSFGKIKTYRTECVVSQPFS